PKYRKYGIAKRLTEFVLNYCSENNIYSLWVGCADCDVEMYKYLGFEIPLGNLLTWASE
ncbi:MAG: GNAT family N-acetyltransferase, partial [Tissierella sp.]|nr:GNAT family N-acetyltransferase [Tissierella sp.]